MSNTVTVTNETTELVQLIREWTQEQHWNPLRNQPRWTEAAMALGVSRPRFTNWYRGANGIDLQNHPEDHRSIAYALQLTMKEVLELNGMDVSDTVPDAATVGSLPRSPRRQNHTTQKVVAMHRPSTTVRQSVAGRHLRAVPQQG